MCTLQVVSAPSVGSTNSPNLVRVASSVGGVIKASPGNLFSLIASTQNNNFGNPNAQFLQWFDSASAPAAGATPIAVFWLGFYGGADPHILKVGREFFSEAGIYFSNGIAYGFSSTRDTYTAQATASYYDLMATYL